VEVGAGVLLGAIVTVGDEVLWIVRIAVAVETEGVAGRQPVKMTNKTIIASLFPIQMGVFMFITLMKKCWIPLGIQVYPNERLQNVRVFSCIIFLRTSSPEVTHEAHRKDRFQCLECYF